MSLFPLQNESLLILLVLSILTFFFYLKQRRSIKPNTLPSPPKLPLIGNLLQLGKLPHRSLQALSQKYGPLMLIHVGRVPTLVVSSSDTAELVMKTHDHIFASRPHSTIADKLLYGAQDVAFSPYGEYWRQVKRICVLHLLSLKRVQSFGPVRNKEITLMVDEIRASPRHVNLSEMIVKLTNRITCRVAFGAKDEFVSRDEGAGLERSRVLIESGALLGEFSFGDFIPCLSWMDSITGLNARVRKNFHELDAFIEKVIEDHEQKRKGSDHGEDTADFVDVLLSLDACEGNAGFSLSRNNIKAVTLDMYLAAVDTTFTALEWTMAELMKHPESMKIAQEEVRRIVGLKHEVEDEDLDQMKYMMAVIKESLRLHPPVPLLVPRESMDNTKLQGYDIPTGTRVFINAWAIMRDPKTWEKPEEFLPNRFVNSSVDFRGQHFGLIPFGAGRRGCPGIGFAMATLELALANLLYHFDWALPDGKNGDSLDMSETSGITSHKESNLVLVAKPHIGD